MPRKSRTKSPRWQRRKEARPAEILSAALELFAAHGFAATKLDDVARRAGVVKGSIYLYFATKEELFRAVVRSAVVPNTDMVRKAAESFDGKLAELVPVLLAGAAAALARPNIAPVARVVIGESRNFPDLARIWHDEVVAPVIGALAAVIARAQKRGEVRKGDARLYAFSLMGPLIMATLFRDVFAGVTDDPPDLAKLAQQHGQAVLQGLLVSPSLKET